MTPCVTEEVHPPTTHTDMDTPTVPVLLLVLPGQLSYNMILP